MNLLGGELGGGVAMKMEGVGLRASLKSPQAGIVVDAGQERFQQRDRSLPSRIHLSGCDPLCLGSQYLALRVSDRLNPGHLLGENHNEGILSRGGIEELSHLGQRGLNDEPRWK